MPSTTTPPASNGSTADDPALARRSAPSHLAPWVFWPSVAILGGFVVFALAVPDTAARVFSTVQDGIVGSLGWYYTLLIAAFVLFSLWMGLSRFGDIRLGRDDEKPEYSAGSWFAMLFSAGMGIGLVFWGVAEPLNHFVSPKPGVDGSQTEIARAAMSQTYLHWGLHPWAIYVVVGLAIAYSVHRRGRPISIRWALEPLLGERVRGRWGDAIDVTAVVGTLVGVATSLGLGVLQLSAGLDYAGLAGPSTSLQVLLIAGITAIATVSVVSGVGRGIKWLSNLNLGLAGALLLFVLVAGPTVFLLREFVQSIGDYLGSVVGLTFDVTAYQGEAGEAWQSAWATFYWGWWISWAPFVGVFIARISRGRTVREFVVGVLGVPTLLTFLWFSVLGGSAIHRELFGGGGLVGSDGAVDTEASLFGLLDALPGGPVLIGVALLLIVSFFVTSSDSGSLVVDMLASGGNPDPPRWSRVFFAVLEGAVAAALLVAVGSGGLTTLQTAAIITALPFSVVMIAMVISLVKAFRGEHQAFLRRQRREQRDAFTDHVVDHLNTTDRATDRAAGSGRSMTQTHRS